MKKYIVVFINNDFIYHEHFVDNNLISIFKIQTQKKQKTKIKATKNKLKKKIGKKKHKAALLFLYLIMLNK